MMNFRSASCFAVLLLTLSNAPAATTQWAGLGGLITGNIALAKNADGRLEAFARARDNTLWHIAQTAPGGAWGQWFGLGGQIISNPAIGVNSDGRLEVFVVGTDNAVWHMSQTSANSPNWVGWSRLGGSASKDDIAVGTNADGRLEIFIHTSVNGLWHSWQTTPGANWSAGEDIPADVDEAPAIARNIDGRLVVFVGDVEGSYWWIIQNTAGADSWSPWWCLLGGLVSQPVMVTNADGRLGVFGVKA
jgi:hypothetical protein